MGKQIDKVVNKVRTSTIEDCENCDEENCDIRYCLISGPHGDKLPPKKQENDNE